MLSCVSSAVFTSWRTTTQNQAILDNLFKRGPAPSGAKKAVQQNPIARRRMGKAQPHCHPFQAAAGPWQAGDTAEVPHLSGDVAISLIQTKLRNWDFCLFKLTERIWAKSNLLQPKPDSARSSAAHWAPQGAAAFLSLSLTSTGLSGFLQTPDFPVTR